MASEAGAAKKSEEPKLRAGKSGVKLAAAAFALELEDAFAEAAGLLEAAEEKLEKLNSFAFVSAELAEKLNGFAELIFLVAAAAEASEWLDALLKLEAKLKAAEAAEFPNVESPPNEKPVVAAALLLLELLNSERIAASASAAACSPLTANENADDEDEDEVAAASFGAIAAEAGATAEAAATELGLKPPTADPAAIGKEDEEEASVSPFASSALPCALSSSAASEKSASPSKTRSLSAKLNSSARRFSKAICVFSAWASS